MASTSTNVVASVLFTLFGGPGLLLVYFPWRITRFHLSQEEAPAQLLLAALLITVGLYPLFESIVRFIVVGRGSLVPALPPRHLVVTGLYRYVRNPMYVGVLTVILGEALLFRSRELSTYFCIVWLSMNIFVLLYEEPKLTRSFPTEYPAYKQNVRRWIPRLTPWTGLPAPRA
jgi:protein-S-isoprenylcysteine O-methyltransferase Ste14